MVAACGCDSAPPGPVAVASLRVEALVVLATGAETGSVVAGSVGATTTVATGEATALPTPVGSRGAEGEGVAELGLEDAGAFDATRGDDVLGAARGTVEGVARGTTDGARKAPVDVAWGLADCARGATEGAVGGATVTEGGATEFAAWGVADAERGAVESFAWGATDGVSGEAERVVGGATEMERGGVDGVTAGLVGAVRGGARGAPPEGATELAEGMLTGGQIETIPLALDARLGALAAIGAWVLGSTAVGSLGARGTAGERGSAAVPGSDPSDAHSESMASVGGADEARGGIDVGAARATVRRLLSVAPDEGVEGACAPVAGVAGSGRDDRLGLSLAAMLMALGTVCALEVARGTVGSPGAGGTAGARSAALASASESSEAQSESIASVGGT